MRYVAMVAALALMSSPALAQDQKGFYLGLGLGMSEVKDVCDGVSGPGVNCDDEDTATKIFGGYQFNANFALEAGYTDLGKAEATQTGVGSVSAEASGFEIVAVGIIPLNPQWSLYGKAGMFSWDVDLKDNTGSGGTENQSGTDLTYGFGAAWNITKNFTLRAEYQVYKDLGDGDPSDVNVLGVNALFRF